MGRLRHQRLTVLLALFAVLFQFGFAFGHVEGAGSSRQRRALSLLARRRDAGYGGEERAFHRRDEARQ